MESKKLVFNYYKAVIYMHPYFSKAENETSEAMKKVAREAYKSRKSTLGKMYAIVRVYSVQKIGYLLIRELWL